MYCGQCGKEYGDSDVFCPEHGTRLEQRAAPSAPAAAVPAQPPAMPVAAVPAVGSPPRAPAAPPSPAATQPVSSQNLSTLLVYSVLLGAFGVDRFYRGQVGIGLLKLFTFGGCTIWALVDTLVYLLGSLPSDGTGAVILEKRTVGFLKR